MPQPRYTQIDIDATADYHVISRCVRRAFLCGYDPTTSRCFDHRKTWVCETLAQLTDTFAIRLHAYSVLSNHFHLVVRIESAAARAWSVPEVVARYARVFPRTAARWARLAPERQTQRAALWRARLADLSWFMRCLNESIARRANREDGCTGHFWEGRFRSQALLDEAALLTCMSYVDLNPIRAGLADSLPAADFTSIQQRLTERAPHDTSPRFGPYRCPVLSRLATPGDRAPASEVPIDLDAYVDLLAATGVALRSDSPIGPPQVAVLAQLGIRSQHWVETVREYPRRFFSMVGTVQRIAFYCARIDRQRAKGTVWARKVFRPAA